MQRATFVVTPEIKKQLEEIKRTDFYDKSWSDMYRFLIEKGLGVVNGKEE